MARRCRRAADAACAGPILRPADARVYGCALWLRRSRGIPAWRVFCCWDSSGSAYTFSGGHFT